MIVHRWERLIERAWRSLDPHSRSRFVEMGLELDRLRTRPPLEVLGIFNIWLALRQCDLTQWVHREARGGQGCLEFHCADEDALCAWLERASAFKMERGIFSWQARERRSRCALHLKTFDGWPRGRVQAHLDAWGLSGLRGALLHAVDWASYRGTARLAGLMMQEGRGDAWLWQLRAEIDWLLL